MLTSKAIVLDTQTYSVTSTNMEETQCPHAWPYL